jgi:hypothetical protein
MLAHCPATWTLKYVVVLVAHLCGAAGMRLGLGSWSFGVVLGQMERIKEISNLQMNPRYTQLIR